MIPNNHELRDFCCVYDCEWTPDRMLRAYEVIVALWIEAGIGPDKLVSQAPHIPGIGNKWGSFKHKRKRLEETKFEGVLSFSLSHLAEPNGYPAELLHPDRDWLVYATATKRRQQCVLGWIPAIIGRPAHAFFEVFRRVASLSHARYGYHYQKRYNLRRAWEMPPETPIQRQWSNNVQSWEPYRTQQAGSLLLRDVFPHNYLSDAHLDAPFGKTASTLREWIEDEPNGRGDLKPFTDILIEWTPPPDNIPHIRETLFRSGRLFYFCFFQEASPYYRPNIREPWEATGPIPEIFQASRYHDLFKNYGLD